MESLRHRLLRRQLKKHLPDAANALGFTDFIKAVDEAYRQFDEDRLMLERSLELSSRELVQANAEMRAILAGLPDLILHLNKEGKIINISGRRPATFGLVPEELLGSNFQHIPYSELASRLAVSLKSLEEENIVASFEYDLTVNGKVNNFKARIIRVNEQQTIVVIHNITERYTHEQQLREAFQQTERLLASISSILIGVDAKNTINRWNSAAKSVFKIDAEQALGQCFEEIQFQWDWSIINANIARAVESSHTVHIEDVKYRSVDGKEGFLGITINPLPPEENKSWPGFLLLASEITERKVMEMQLTQAQKLESIGQLAAGIAHEINTPAQFIGDNALFLDDSFQDILGLFDHFKALLEAARSIDQISDMAETIEETVEDVDLDYLLEEIPQAIHQSREGIERISAIVSAMKAFSHPGTTEKVLFNINYAIENAVAVSRHEWKYVADVELNLDPSLPEVPCLPGEFNQVILNLIVNAAHAIADKVQGSGADGRIILSTTLDAPFVEIIITDTGTGIPEEIISRIFDPFFTTKEVGKGTGQGLAITHDVITKKHQGTIRVSSVVGEGTTFTIQLPLGARS